jgi:hypothetical protein
MAKWTCFVGLGDFITLRAGRVGAGCGGGGVGGGFGGDGAWGVAATLRSGLAAGGGTGRGVVGAALAGGVWTEASEHIGHGLEGSNMTISDGSKRGARGRILEGVGDVTQCSED